MTINTMTNTTNIWISIMKIMSYSRMIIRWLIKTFYKYYKINKGRTDHNVFSPQYSEFIHLVQSKVTSKQRQSVYHALDKNNNTKMFNRTRYNLNLWSNIWSEWSTIWMRSARRVASLELYFSFTVRRSPALVLIPVNPAFRTRSQSVARMNL